ARPEVLPHAGPRGCGVPPVRRVWGTAGGRCRRLSRVPGVEATGTPRAQRRVREIPASAAPPSECGNEVAALTVGSKRSCLGMPDGFATVESRHGQTEGVRAAPPG